MSWHVVLALAGLAVLAASRSVYRLMAPHGIDRDAYAHLHYARDIREHGHRLPDRPQKVVTSGGYAYPFFMHWVLSFVPPRYYPAVDRFFSPLLDLLFAGLLFTLVPLEIVSPDESLGMLLVFIVTPQFMRADLPNAIGLSGRKPGLLVTTIALLGLVFWTLQGSILALAVAVLFGGLVFLTSKFSIQAFVFVGVAVGIGADPVALIVLVASFVTAVVLSGGEYVGIFRDYLNFLYAYATVKQYKLFDPIRFDLLTLAREIDSAETFLRVAYRNRIVRPLTSNPYFIAVALTFLFEVMNPVSVAVPWIFRVWILGAVCAFVLTSLPHFLFLGKAERYLEYAFVPASLYVVRGWSTFGPEYRAAVGIVLLGGVGIIAVYVLTYTDLFYSPSREAEWDRLLDRLRSVERGIVLIQPFWGGRKIAWETDHQVVDCILNEGAADNDEIDTLFPEKYGVVTSDTEWLKAQYDPDWVVFDLEDLPSGVGLRPPGSPLFETETLQLYAFESVLNDRSD